MKNREGEKVREIKKISRSRSDFFWMAEPLLVLWSGLDPENLDPNLNNLNTDPDNLNPDPTNLKTDPGNLHSDPQLWLLFSPLL
mgnify:CR=1 FL=1